MAILTCPSCGAKNRVDDRLAGSLQPVCGRCKRKLGARSTTAGGAGVDASRPVEVSDATFERDVVEASHARPVLVDCWAPWCGPCRLLAPTIDALAAESGGRYLVAKLNTDENPRVASQLGISGIPAVLIYRGGRPVDRMVGLQPKPALAARLAAVA